MEIHHKIIVVAIACATLVLLSAVGYNVMDSNNRIQANKECVAANERIAARMIEFKSETIRVTSLPTCNFR